MATTATKSATPALTVFGTRPKDAIFLPNQPFALRNNCQIGQFCVGDDDFRGNELEMSIIKASQYFGSLGKTKNVQWIQIFFIPAPGCTIAPTNTVCVMYAKTRSASAFWTKVTEIMQTQEPAEGIFKVGFTKHNGEMGHYYSLTWDWRERTTKEEKDQLDTIVAFMQSNPVLVDLNTTRDMVCIDNLSTEDIEMLVEATKAPQATENGQAATTALARR